MANELSKNIKKELIKNTTLKARTLSVRYAVVGYSDKVDIYIKDERFPLSVVENIVQMHEQIDRDNFSGEILLGGNTYISVNYPWDLVMSQEFKDELENVISPCLTLELSNADDFELNRWRKEKSVLAIQQYMNSVEELEYTISDARSILYKYNS